MDADRPPEFTGGDTTARRRSSRATDGLEFIKKYNALRRTGLVFGLVADILLTIVLGFVGCLSQPDFKDVFVYMALPILALFGSLLAAWRWDLAGGMAILAEGLYILVMMLAVYTPGWSPGLTTYALVFFCLPLFVSGSLFISAWFISQKSSRAL